MSKRGSRNSNSVCIPTVRTGCLQVAFDSKYPTHLYGVISRDEFQESINRMNDTISSNRIAYILVTIFGFSIVVGIALLIVNIGTQDIFNTNRFPPLVGVGVGVLVGGPIIAGLGLCAVQYQRITKLRQIIAEESIKYSSRSPISSSWRLEIVTHCLGGFEDDYNSRLVYHLLIDIERPTISENLPYHFEKTPNETTLLL